MKENMGDNWLGKDYLAMILKARSIKEQIDNWTSSKFKTSPRKTLLRDRK